jgi:very-long-chain ceramide synthase
MASKTQSPNGSANGKLENGHAAEVHQHKSAAAPKRRKTPPGKADEQGLLATVCSLICDHQIGRLAFTFATKESS